MNEFLSTPFETHPLEAALIIFFVIFWLNALFIYTIIKALLTLMIRHGDEQYRRGTYLRDK